MRPAAASRARLGAQDLAVAILDRGGGFVDQRIFHPAVEHDLRRWKGGRSPACAQHRRQSRYRLAAGGSDRDGKLGGFALDRVAPMVVVIAHSSSRLRERSERSSADTRLECSLSIASTSRSKKRRRSEAAPRNSPSIAGASHTMRR